MSLCPLCNQVILSDADTAKEVRGWVSGPKKDSMRAREDTGRVAHAACVEVLIGGQDPAQPDLFGHTGAEG